LRQFFCVSETFDQDLAVAVKVKAAFRYVMAVAPALQDEILRFTFIGVKQVKNIDTSQIQFQLIIITQLQQMKNAHCIIRYSRISINYILKLANESSF